MVKSGCFSDAALEHGCDIHMSWCMQLSHMSRQHKLRTEKSATPVVPEPWRTRGTESPKAWTIGSRVKRRGWRVVTAIRDAEGQRHRHRGGCKDGSV